MLDKKLEKYAEEGIYPFHMPGHKRQLEGMDPYKIDITEITDFDNLHHAKGVLADLQERAAQLYGAGKSYGLVNGSTCGILAAICGATGKGDKVLVARNCHKAVYHGIFLKELEPVFVYSRNTRIGIQGQIVWEDVQKSLEEHPDIKAVILTSPTYDGVVSDIRSIAHVVHERGIPLIVDEAHGAHFGMAEDLPQNAVTLGADAVIVSVHKTLPAFTQTALLHLCSDRIPAIRVEEYLDIFETSSPSYVLLAGIERCVRMMTEKKEVLFAQLRRNLNEFYNRTAQLKHLHVLQPSDLSGEEAFAFDDSKLVILVGDSGLDGKQLHGKLREEYGLELEMAYCNYVLALCTVMDTRDGLCRLAEALCAIDRSCEKKKQLYLKKERENISIEICRPKEKSMELYDACSGNFEYISLQDACGRICADYILPYPPGIPILIPGERVDQQCIQEIMFCAKIGLEMEGLQSGNRIKVVNLEKK